MVEIHEGTDDVIGSFLSNVKIIDDPEWDAMVQEEERKQEENRLTDYFKTKSGVPAKYHEMRLSDFNAYNEELKKNLEDVKNFIEECKLGKNKTLWLCGSNGNGKTLLGALIVRETMGNYAESSMIEDEIEESKHYGAKETITALRKRYTDYRLLVIDEIARFPSDEEKRNLFKILNDRYNAEKPTVLISNLSRQELQQYLGKGLTDRFMENCKSVTFTSPSYRTKIREN